MVFERDKSFLNDPESYRSNALTKALGIRKAMTSKESLERKNDTKELKKKTLEMAIKAMREIGLN